MDVLLAPVYETFLSVRSQCLAEGGFVVGPMGESTAGVLFDFCHEVATRDKEFPNRFAFDPWLAGVVYESHPSAGPGGFRYMGLIDEIEINAHHQPYRFPRMKPGEGHHGEPKYDERMPAFVRFRSLIPIADIIPDRKQLYGADLGVGASEAVLRQFRTSTIRSSIIRLAFESMQSRLR